MLKNYSFILSVPHRTRCCFRNKLIQVQQGDGYIPQGSWLVLTPADSSAANSHAHLVSPYRKSAALKYRDCTRHV